MNNRNSMHTRSLSRLYILLSFFAFPLLGIAQENLISMANTTGLLDKETCHKISLHNFDQHGLGVYELSWDANLITLSEANSDTKDFFGDYQNQRNIENGKLQFTITKEMLSDVQLGRIKPTVCFQNLKEGRSELIIKKVDQAQKSNTSNGSITFSKFPFVGEKLIASSEIAASGTEACVEVSVEGFTSIRRLTFGLNAGATIATFSRTNNFNLPGLNATNVANNGVFGIEFDWESPNQTTGVTVPNGTVILDFCYDIVGPSASSIDVTFTSATTFNIFFGIDGSENIAMAEPGSITIPNVAPLEIQSNVISPDNCFETDNGSVEITPNGGTIPYSYIWSNLTTNQILSDVAGGSYTVTVSDSSNPINEFAMTFLVPTDTISPIADVGVAQSITCIVGVVSIGGANTSAGDEFVYQWLGPAGVAFVSGQNDPIAEVDTPGEYTLRVINASNGCTAENSVMVIRDMDGPNLLVPEDQNLTCLDGGLTLTAMNDQDLSDIVAVWRSDDGVIDAVIDELSVSVSTPGTYEVVLTNSNNGCTSIDQVVITPAVLPTIALDGEVNPLNCDQNTVMISVTIDPTNTILWTTINGVIEQGVDEETVVVSSAGIYIGVVTNTVTNCTATLEVQVEGNTEEPTVSAGEDVTITCANPVANLLGMTDSAMGSTIAWVDELGNFSGNELALDVNRVGTFVLSITNEFGCQRMDEVVVAADTMSPIANAGFDFEVACIGVDIFLDGTASSMGSEFSFMWSTSNGILASGFNTLTPAISSAGTYDLIVTNNENGCSSLSAVVVSLQGDLPVADGGVDFSSCENQALLSGNLAPGVTGIWTTTSSSNIDNPTSADISISNLNPGDNAFIWSLSTAVCADFSRDTVTISFESTPIALEDVQSIPTDSTTASSNVLFNDNINGNGGGVIVTFQSTDPNLMDLGDGSYTYTFPNDSLNTFSFNYIVCSEVCPMFCDSTTVIINREEPMIEPVDIDGLPNAITPNGDGLNDALVFDIMLTNPEDFPNPELVVFNRWGDVVFEQRPYDNNWQGTNQNGAELPEGTYYFINRLSLENSEILTGDVTIIRD